MPCIQHPDPLGTMKFLRGKGQQVNALSSHINGDLARSLYRVRMEQNTPFSAYRTNLGNRLDGADFIVGIHYRHKAGILMDGLFYLRGGNDTVWVNIQQLDYIPFLLQPLQCTQYGMVFKRSGEDMLLSGFGPRQSYGNDGLAIRLTSPPEVKMISSGSAFRQAAIRSLALLNASKDLWPGPYMPEGLYQLSSQQANLQINVKPQAALF